MTNKKITIILICTLLMTTVFSLNVFASSVGDKEDELENVNNSTEEAKTELAQIANNIEALESDIATLNSELQQKTDEYNASVEELNRIKDEMQQREDGVNGRLRTMYKNGSVGFIDVILQSESIEDFLSNLGLVQVIHKNDVEVLDQLEKDHLVVEEESKKLEASKLEIEKTKVELDANAAALNEQKALVEDKIQNFEADADRLEEEIKELLDENLVYDDGEFAWPTPGYLISSPYGWRTDPIVGGTRFHSGVDIAEYYGEPIYAAKSGRVILARWYGDYGNTIIIDHGGGVTTLYAHASSLSVSVGDIVTKKEVIAKIGSTGYSTGPHLHFEIRINGARKNPLSFY